MKFINFATKLTMCKIGLMILLMIIVIVSFAKKGKIVKFGATPV